MYRNRQFLYTYIPTVYVPANIITIILCFFLSHHNMSRAQPRYAKHGAANK